MDNQSIITPFEGKTIRKAWHNDEMYFSVVDVIQILTDSSNPSRYWADLKRRAEKEADAKVFAFCEPLKMQTAGGKQNVVCANTEGVFRIIMSVPSAKAEPLKMWLAEQGKRAIDEADNPELLTERQAELYKAKGYPDEWIKRRIQSIETRKALTDEWKQRGIKEGQEYSILTATIAKGTFGVTPSEHKEIKGLDKPAQNLRDHMTPLELVFTALSEEVTRSIIVKDNSEGFVQNQEAAAYGGSLAGKARQQLEKDRGVQVVSSENYLGLKGAEQKTEELPSEK